jgi:hypothetical protein
LIKRVREVTVVPYTLFIEDLNLCHQTLNGYGNIIPKRSWYTLKLFQKMSYTSMNYLQPTAYCEIYIRALKLPSSNFGDTRK